MNEIKYSLSSLTKSSGSLADMNLLFANWDEAKSVEENFDAAIRRNLFGKATRNRVAVLLQIFHRRFLPPNGTGRAFRVFVGSSLPAEVTDRVVYYYTALAEPVLHDFVVEYLYPLFLRGEQTVTATHAVQFLQEAISQGKTEGKWESEETRRRTAQGLLSTLRDLGVLSGSKGSPYKTLAPRQLHVLAFAYVAFHVKRTEVSGERMIHHPHWRLFFLRTADVERYFAEAAAEKLLTYQAAGSIVRIEFPTADFEEYVNALTARTF
ncbi:MAG: DUF1819 family protein [Chloroflexi bacterium]|nr:DUF1819 family protein [Chloroflexota bacterium]